MNWRKKTAGRQKKQNKNREEKQKREEAREEAGRVAGQTGGVGTAGQLHMGMQTCKAGLGLPQVGTPELPVGTGPVRTGMQAGT